MKLILAGATGFIGSEILRQCLRAPTFTSIIVLSRRALPVTLAKHTKLTVIIMKDFTVYPAEVLSQLEGADACIWSMGTTAAIPEVELDYPLAFARAFAPTIPAGQTAFRFLHTSGVLAEKDQSKSLLFFQEGRRIKGKAETELLAFAQEEAQTGRWETYVARPAMVLKKEGDILKRMGGFVTGTVRVDVLAAVMIDVVCSRNQDGRIIENTEIMERGTLLVKGQKGK
ncbi:hypothetical protein GGX14DRAFT_369740 [Mycena pura]|uniref:NAD(P)-binding domain-containing protein n=1 Tax=Mycena pura TaxID=153505 RepID=A0AAD6YCX3_9AGAR|nr:hypothetical protein GGX14DRAFT_369740 [Mycena pura]